MQPVTLILNYVFMGEKNIIILSMLKVSVRFKTALAIHKEKMLALLF